MKSYEKTAWFKALPEPTKRKYHVMHQLGYKDQLHKFHATKARQLDRRHQYVCDNERKATKLWKLAVAHARMAGRYGDLVFIEG